MNTARMTDADVVALLVQDGLGPDEALDHVADYARAITGNVSPTAQLRVRQSLRRIYRDATGARL